MANERVTERTDGVTSERVVERTEPTSPATTVVAPESRGGGMGAVLMGLAALLLVAVVAYFLINRSQQGEERTEAVSEAASSVASSVEGAAESVGDAANRAADAVTPE